MIRGVKFKVWFTKQSKTSTLPSKAPEANIPTQNSSILTQEYNADTNIDQSSVLYTPQRTINCDGF